MSLNVHYDKIENYKEACYEDATYDDPYHGFKKGDRIRRVETDALSMATMSVDLGSIKASNVNEWMFRLRYMEATGCYMMSQNGKGIKFPYEEVVKHIGLSANVIDTTRAAFLKKMSKCVEREVEYTLRQEADQRRIKSAHAEVSKA